MGKGGGGRGGCTSLCMGLDRLRPIQPRSGPKGLGSIDQRSRPSTCAITGAPSPSPASSLQHLSNHRKKDIVLPMCLFAAMHHHPLPIRQPPREVTPAPRRHVAPPPPGTTPLKDPLVCIARDDHGAPYPDLEDHNAAPFAPW
jgi:hypothetical protein